jgi:hypothetical protein
MTQNQYQGQGSRQTGDINLAAALMACAIPLDPLCPVKVIMSDFQRPYATFKVGESSSDGVHITEHLMLHWSNQKLLPEVSPFAAICDFIKAKPDGKLSSDDWLDHAVRYLAAQGVSLPGLRRISDIADFVAKFPKNPESYILAFVANRVVCQDLYHNARRATYQSVVQEGNARHTLIDTKLPTWQRNELLSRLQG